jgi:hypothetical protein
MREKRRLGVKYKKGKKRGNEGERQGTYQATI